MNHLRGFRPKTAIPLFGIYKKHTPLLEIQKGRLNQPIRNPERAAADKIDLKIIVFQ